MSTLNVAENCAKPSSVYHPDCLIYSCVERGSNPLDFLKHLMVSRAVCVYFSSEIAVL